MKKFIPTLLTLTLLTSCNNSTPTVESQSTVSTTTQTSTLKESQQPIIPLNPSIPDEPTIPDEPDNPVIPTEPEPADNPVIPTESESINTKALTQASLDYFKLSADYTHNNFMSPTSVISALGLVYEAADEEAKQELTQQATGYEKDLYEQLPEFLSSQNQDVIKSANSIWVNSKTGKEELVPSLKTAVKTIHKATIEAHNLSKDITPINEWVSANTDNLITKVLDQPAPPDTDAIIVNTILFEDKWEDEFDPSNTYKEEFTTGNNIEVRVDMMHKKLKNNNYIETNNAKGVILDYKNNYAMLVLLPDDSVSLKQVVESITPDQIYKLMQHTSDTPDVNLSMPKLDITDHIPLVQTLNKLGIKRIFNTPSLNIITQHPSIVSDIFQDTRLIVNEQETKAAAATTIMMQNAIAVADKPITIELNRPYIILIVDTKTSVPFFIGTINNPLE